MNWPLASDYQDAVQNPAQCFGDAQLKLCRPVVTKLGLPRVASGTFASVYELCNLTAHPPQRWAVRCFSRPGTDQQNRYALLSEYLSRRHIPELVGFTYHAQGIRIRGHWFPIVTMEWVEGTTLHTYIGQHIGNADRLRSLAAKWRDLAAHLKANHIAHGDLQHGNVLVTGAGELRLVDYDGMFVPDLHGQPSRELGHPNYQHPQRASADYNEKLDDFAALVIYTSLVALSYDPDLWEQFHTGENLIFSESDFKAPQKSPAFERLYHSSQDVVRELSRRLALACEGTLARVPDFAHILASVPAIPVPQPWWHTEDASPDKGQRPVPVGDASRANVPHASTNTLPASAQDVPPASAQDMPPGWWKAPPKAHAVPAAPVTPASHTEGEDQEAEDDSRNKKVKDKEAGGLLQALLRLWNDTRTSSDARTAAASATSPTPPVAAPRPSNRERPRRTWLTCSSISCLLACLAVYGLVMAVQLALHKAHGLLNDIDRHIAITRKHAPARRPAPPSIRPPVPPFHAPPHQ